MNDIKKIELLSPVGTRDSMISALNNGCDAIYLGGKNFNARSSADNFTDEQLCEIIKYCHLRGVKVNLTLNILYKENELQKVLDFVSKVYSYGIDAFIVQDIGMFSLIKKHFKNVNLHASTQMTIHNIEGVKFLKNLGFDRVVLSRELSLDEIKDIIKNVDIQIECFVHGAICVSYSGRCLISSLVGNRSGNRGKCAQSCRMDYKLIKDNKIYAKAYALSPKDSSSLPIIDELVSSGIHTFKIEGRMKSPEYVASVTSLYRKYIDKAYNNNFINISDMDLKELTQVFNRGGSSMTGYFKTWSSKNMLSLSPKSSGLKIGIVKSYNKKTKCCTIKLTDNTMAGDGIEIWTKSEPHCGTNISKTLSIGDILTITIYGNINEGDLVFKSFDKFLDNKLKSMYKRETRKMDINANVTAKIGMPLKITLSSNEICITTYGDIIESAINSSVTNDKLLKNISKTGDSPFNIIFKDIYIDENIYINISAINSLRREAISMLELKIIDNYNRPMIKVLYNKDLVENKINYLTTLILNKEQFDACVESNLVKRIYIELSKSIIDNLDYFVNIAKNHNIELYIALNPIVRKIMAKDFYDILKILENSDIDGYLLRNYINLDTNKKIIADHTFNIFNNASITTLLNLFDGITMSPELNLRELNTLSSHNSEVLVYGKLPLMTTHQCPVGIFVGNKGKDRFCNMQNKWNGYYLQDDNKNNFLIQNDCFNCVTTILSDKPLFILNKAKEVSILKNNFRLCFINEDKKDIINLIQKHYDALIMKNPKFTNDLEIDYTNGHFFKGVL